MAYSKDLRQKVIEYLKSGHTQREARETFHISTAAINRRRRLYTKTGKLEDKKPCRGFKKLDPEKSRAYVKEHPDACLKEIGEAFDCTDTSVRKAFFRLEITRKKRQHTAGSKNPNKRRNIWR